MSITHYNKTVDSEITYVTGGDVSELLLIASAYQDDGDTWHIEDDAVVFERPMGEGLARRVPRREEQA